MEQQHGKFKYLKIYVYKNKFFILHTFQSTRTREKVWWPNTRDISHSEKKNSISTLKYKQKFCIFSCSVSLRINCRATVDTTECEKNENERNSTSVVWQSDMVGMNKKTSQATISYSRRGERHRKERSREKLRKIVYF